MKLVTKTLLLVLLLTLPSLAQEVVKEKKWVTATASSSSTSSSSSSSSSYSSSRVFVSGEALYSQDKSAENLYRKARHLYFKRKYAEATAVYESLIKHFPKSNRASQSIYNMGICYEKLGYSDKAFDCYKKAINDYQQTMAGKQSLLRATKMARTMRRFQGDEYDNFLKGILESDNFFEEGKRYTAAVMAASGDWSGLDHLLQSFDKGSVSEQIKVSELLTRKADDARVRQVFRKALRNSKNEIVRANALYALRGTLAKGDGKKDYIFAMLNDRYYANRARAFAMLTPYFKDEDVKKAFSKAIYGEKDPHNLNNFAMFFRSKYKGDKLAEIASKRIQTEKNPVNQMMLTGMLGRKTNFGQMDISTMKGLLDSPNPNIRISALRVLEDRADNPQVKNLLVNKLKNDPSGQVRIGAINALSGVVKDDDVRAVFIETIEKSDDTALVATSIQAIRGELHIKGVRDTLVKTLNTRHQPMISYQIVNTLSHQVDKVEVADGFIRVLQDPKPHKDVKMAITYAFERAGKLDPDVPRKFYRLYVSEKDKSLADSYFRIIKKADPKKAEELKLEKLEEFKLKKMDDMKIVQPKEKK